MLVSHSQTAIFFILGRGKEKNSGLATRDYFNVRSKRNASFSYHIAYNTTAVRFTHLLNLVSELVQLRKRQLAKVH